MDALDNEEMLLVLQQALTKKHVLIVDRHPPARDSLRIMLSALGVTAVHGAGNSAEVLRQVKNNRFDIVLSDFLLDDGRDGQQLLEELRRQRLIPLETVYIIITGERSYNNVVSLAELAPDDYLIKPFTADQLQTRLIRAIYKKHVLHRVYNHIEGGDLAGAIAACDRVIGLHPQYLYDALRFKGELLHTLGRESEAEEVYRRVLAGKAVPWAKMGLAQALKERGKLADAEALAQEVTSEAPNFLSAYDFLASVHEAQGRLDAAQATLQRAADMSPNNTLRQSLVGDIALRNGDLLNAEKAYGKVLERHRGSSLKSVDDFANLSRVLLEKDDLAASRRILADMKREWRGDKLAELAGLTMESLCLRKEGNAAKADEVLDSALQLQQQIDSDGKDNTRLAVDLAHACLAGNRQDEAQQIMRRVAAENNENPQLMSRIDEVFRKTGNEAAGKTLLDQVSNEIVELNNRGVMAARAGDLEGSVQLLIQAADQVPSLQFLTNACKAIFTLLDRKGWDAALAKRGLDYLARAEAKDRGSPKVASARDLYTTVARRHGQEHGTPAA